MAIDVWIVLSSCYDQKDELTDWGRQGHDHGKKVARPAIDRGSLVYVT
jgi:hypothetical protein